MSERRNKRLYCSFCGKRHDEVACLVAGPTSIFICNECVAQCVHIVAQHKRYQVGQTSTALLFEVAK